MGLFFTTEEEKYVAIIEKQNNTIKLAKNTLEYTSENPNHLVEYYKNILSVIAHEYDPDILMNLYAEKNNIKLEEAPSHMMNRLKELKVKK